VVGSKSISSLHAGGRATPGTGPHFPTSAVGVAEAGEVDRRIQIPIDARASIAAAVGAITQRELGFRPATHSSNSREPAVPTTTPRPADRAALGGPRRERRRGRSRPRRLPQTIHAIANGDEIAAARTVLAAIPPPGGGYGLVYGVFCREDARRPGTRRPLVRVRRARSLSRSSSLSPTTVITGTITASSDGERAEFPTSAATFVPT
jgi:hypothetical protein